MGFLLEVPKIKLCCAAVLAINSRRPMRRVAELAWVWAGVGIVVYIVSLKARS
jgi:hypothetical protein